MPAAASPKRPAQLPASAGQQHPHAKLIGRAKARARGILGRQHRRDPRGQWPGDAQVRIVPAKGVFVIRIVKIRALVHQIGGIAQDAEAVGKPGRDPELLVPLGIEAHDHVPAEGGRGAAEIHRHVEHLAGHDPHQLALRAPELVVQPPQHAAGRAAVIVLHEVGDDAGRRELPAVPGLHEEPAIIAEQLRLDKEDVGNRRGRESHGRSGSAATRSRYSP